MNNTQLIFVVGSGRCGTKMIKSLLAGTNIEARHEYVRNAYQREAAMYYLGRLSYGEMSRKLKEIYIPAAHYSQSPIFLDSSHKLSWCVDVLMGIFPEAKFIHLVRDGRKVVSSFFYKLNIFDDHGAEVLRNWYKNGHFPMPPLTENFWQPASLFNGDMFQRICHHWVISNQAIITNLKNVSYARKISVRLEDLITSKSEMERFLNFVGVEYNDSFFDAMQKPKHVYVPVDYELTEVQQRQFDEICAPMMKRLGYGEKENYHVKYQL